MMEKNNVQRYVLMVTALVLILMSAGTGSALPISGDLNGDGTDSYGTFDPSTAGFTFDGKTVNFGTSTDLPVIGDWDHDGKDEIGVYRPDTGSSQSEFHLVTRDWTSLSEDAGAADNVIPFGYYPTNIPIAGDWDGDGDDDIGGFNPGNNKFYLYILNLGTESATSYKDVPFGISGDEPIIGDWDGDGDDDVGVYREYDPDYSGNLVFYFDLDLGGDQADLTPIPLGDNEDVAVIGDWDADGDDDVGLYRAGTFIIDPDFNVPHDLVYLDDGIVKVGVDLEWGGAISVIMHQGMNLIDNHDTGRLAQVAFYNDDSGTWDPVQGGDVSNQGSPVLDYNTGTNVIYTKTQPRDWNTSVLTDTYVEQWVSLEGQSVKVQYKFTHFGTDTYTFHDQEFPCAYINSRLYKLFTYTNGNPWTNDGVNELIIPQTDPGTPNTEFYPTEYWASFVNDMGFGLTLYSPDHTSKWAAHRFTCDTKPSYLVTVDQFVIEPGTVEEATEYFIVGDYPDVRNIVYSLESSQPPTVITVDDDGPADYNTIQAAVDAASAGDTIEVRSGTYVENVDVDKRLTLEGDGADVVTVQAADTSDHVFNVTADWVNISGFTMNGARLYYYPAGIYLRTTIHCNISYNDVADNDYGIYLQSSSNNTIFNNNVANNGDDGISVHSSNNNVISKNDISNNVDGILLYASRNNTISNNNVSNNYGGILLGSSNDNLIINNIFANDGLSVPNSYGNTVKDNTINGKPLVYLEKEANQIINNAGQVILVKCNNITIKNLDVYYTRVSIELWETTNSEIKDNNISDSVYGIQLHYSGDNAVSNNNISNNGCGIFLDHSSSGNMISNNNISNNECGTQLSHSSTNGIYLNNFINNKNNFYLSYSSTNIWNSTSKIAYTYNGSGFENYLGNHWDDYTDVDTNNDGIWDNHYNIDSDNDNYPLVEPWENYVELKGSPWPMFGHDPQHTGQSQYVGAQTNTLKWTLPLTGIPSIGADGTIYVSKHAINSNGSIKWELVYPTLNGAAIGADGTVYTGYDNQNLYAIDPNGTVKWVFETESKVGTGAPYPVIGTDGTIYFNSLIDFDPFIAKLYAVNVNGTEKWNYTFSGLFSGPAIGFDGTIYFGVIGSNWGLYAINPDGSLKWRSYVSLRICGSPSIASDGTIYLQTDYGLWAINPDGTIKWRADYIVDPMASFTPAISRNGTIYAISENKLFAVNPNGTQKWNYSSNDRFSSRSPAIGADETIYLGSNDRTFYALNANGVLKWKYSTTGYGFLSSAIGADGTVYVGDYAGQNSTFYAFDPNPSIYSVGQGAPDLAIKNHFTAAYNRNGAANVLGNPTTAVHKAWGYWVQDFPGASGYAGGIIMYNPYKDYAYYIHGTIWDRYYTLGGPNAKTDIEFELGLPISDIVPYVHTLPPAVSSHGTQFRYQNFEGGALDLNVDTGAVFEIHGAIFAKWRELGYAAGDLGLVTSDEQEAAISAIGTEGRVSDFEGGHIHWHRNGPYANTAFETHGAIDVVYCSEDGSGGWLGFPVSNEYVNPSGYAQSDFEGGYITTTDGVNYEAFVYATNPPTNLAQFKSDSTTEIPVGGTTNERTVIFKGTVSDPDGDMVKLQVELRRLDEYGGQFDETKGGLKDSGFVASGSEAVAYAIELIDADYHWRARAVDEHGDSSEWQQFGGNDISEADFVVNQNGGQNDKDKLIDSLEELREAMLFKLDWEIDTTAQTFTSVRGYQQSKKWADLFGAPLNILQGTLQICSIPQKIKELAEEPNRAFTSSKSLLEGLSISVMMHGLIESGEDMYYGLYGPPYGKAVEDMLKSADDEIIFSIGPIEFNFDSNIYKDYIKSYLILPPSNARSPLLITRRSGKENRNIIGSSEGILRVRISINKEFNSLIEDINRNDLPDDFPTEEVIAQINELTSEIKQSLYATENIDVGYDTYLQDEDEYIPKHVQIKLGAPAKSQEVFRDMCGMVAEKIDCEITAEMVNLEENIELVISYYIPKFGKRIEIPQTIISIAGMTCDVATVTYYSNAEDEFYMLPQEMLFSVQTESSNLWMMADDVNRYLRYRIDILEPSIPEDQIPVTWAHLCSPGELSVYDAQRRVTGLVNGEIKEEIPDSDYYENTVTIFFPSDSYRYEVVGTDTGTYGLDVTSVEDGNATNFTATDIPTLASATHQYTINWSTLSEGGKGVTVKIDSDGDGVFEQHITTDNTFYPPLANFAYTPQNPVVTQLITFNASNSTDPDGTITNYEWNFGDGNVTNTTEAIINHSYASTGVYTVNLTVTDNDGATNTKTKLITVTNLCGDVAPYPNSNGEVDMGDVIRLLNHVGYPGNSTYTLCNDWAGDCRCTGVRNMGDVVLLLNNVSCPENQRYVLDCC
ncbi:hypothetical protein C5S31_06635 [ANME-1 cluster archaeon GoMg2]|nr:hypothetical protein [ANME-1 cluster archaeon GoMg2]